jgi:hypothetical protein
MQYCTGTIHTITDHESATKTADTLVYVSSITTTATATDIGSRGTLSRSAPAAFTSSRGSFGLLPPTKRSAHRELQAHEWSSERA